jgi:hypothetical protein
MFLVHLTAITWQDKFHVTKWNTIVNDESGRTWKEGVVAYIKVLPQNLSVGIMDNYETLNQNSRSQFLKWNPRYHEHEPQW